MSAPQTACVAAPPCPSWCNPDLHSRHFQYLVHYSDPRFFEGRDTGFRFEAWIERHDEAGGTGDADLGVRVHPEPGAFGSDGWLPADTMRELAQWLFGMADLCDPHRTNGRPVERRQAVAG